MLLFLFILQLQQQMDRTQKSRKSTTHTHRRINSDYFSQTLAPVTIEQMFQKIIRKTNPKQFNKMKESSIQDQMSEMEIINITNRAFKDQKNNRNQKISVINMIKGKPYCLKLGKIQPNIDNFHGFYDTFYSNLYKDASKSKNQSDLINTLISPHPKVQSRDTSRKINTADNHTRTISHDNQYRFRSIKRFNPKPKAISNGIKQQKKIYRKKILSKHFDHLINSCNALLNEKNQDYTVIASQSRKQTQLECFKEE